jgi:predicted DNA binding CopG/RHH family protein
MTWSDEYKEWVLKHTFEFSQGLNEEKTGKNCVESPTRLNSNESTENQYDKASKNNTGDGGVCGGQRVLKEDNERYEKDIRLELKEYLESIKFHLEVLESDSQANKKAIQKIIREKSNMSFADIYLKGKRKVQVRLNSELVSQVSKYVETNYSVKGKPADLISYALLTVLENNDKKVK